MSRRNVLAALIAVVVALGCARLGIWQLSRAEIRRAHNEHLAGRLVADPVPVQAVQGDTAERYRRVVGRGVLDYQHELFLANRVRNGSPGVHVITPLRLLDGDDVILVNRGWLYSPDAARVDAASWREADTVTVSGYLDRLGHGERGAPAEIAPRSWYRADSAAIAPSLPYPIPGLVLVAADIEPSTERAPARVGLPSFDEGRNISYAFQWFIFGTIALVGGTLLIVQDVRRRRG